MIIVKNLCKKYGKIEALKNINLEIKKGEIFVIMGPTGSGKTTLLRLIDLLEPPTSGEIFFAGVCVTKQKKKILQIRRRMAMVFQNPVLFNTSVYENVAYGLRIRKKKNIDKKVKTVLKLVDLLQYENRNAYTLSGGEIQRVAIAQAIAIEPEVLLLDEPTVNLDQISTEKIEKLILHIVSEYNSTVIIATHNIAQAMRLANRIAILINGEIVQLEDKLVSGEIVR